MKKQQEINLTEALVFLEIGH